MNKIASLKFKKWCLRTECLPYVTAFSFLECSSQQLVHFKCTTSPCELHSDQCIHTMFQAKYCKLQLTYGEAEIQIQSLLFYTKQDAMEINAHFDFLHLHNTFLLKQNDIVFTFPIPPKILSHIPPFLSQTHELWPLFFNYCYIYVYISICFYKLKYSSKISSVRITLLAHT